MLKREQLFNYQDRGVDFIKEKRKCALFLDMGMGKTTTTLTAIRDMFDDFSAFRVLIIAPLRVANTVWKQESQKWQHLNDLNIGIATGTEGQRKAVLERGYDITIINRENVPWLVEFYKAKHQWPFDTIVIDESTSFKNSASKRFKAMKQILKYVYNIVLLTGTPSPQGMIDLWSQMYMIDFGERLGRNKSTFLNLYFETSGFQHYEHTMVEGCDRVIRAKIKDVCMTMLSEDYLELPEMIPLRHTVILPDAAKKTYKELKKEMLITVKGGTDISAPSAAALNNKLLQICNGAVYDEDGTYHIIHDGKIEALKDIIENNPDENLLVAYNFKSDKERLMKAFPFAVVLDKEGVAVDQWNKGEIKMLLAHPQSAGHGLNMQFGGSTLIYFGLTWSLEYYQQFNKRLHRQGQKSNVRIIHIVVEGGVDEAVMEAINNKAKSQSDLINYLKKYYEVSHV